MQWLLFAKGSTVQQRASFHWEREGCTLFAWASTSHCQQSVTSGLCLLIVVLYKIWEYYFPLPLLSHYFFVLSIGEEADAQHQAIWGSLAKVRGHDGPSGKNFVKTEIFYIKWGYESWEVTTQYFVLVNRRGMKGCFTNFSLTMLRNCCQLYILLLLGRLARNMGAYSGVLRVFTLVWKKSIILYFPALVCNFQSHSVQSCKVVGHLQG